MKDRFYKELEQVFDKFPQYHTKIFLGDSHSHFIQDNAKAYIQ
jgi:hypothetical protein